MSFWQLRIAFPSLSAGAGFDVANVWRHEIGTDKRLRQLTATPSGSSATRTLSETPRGRLPPSLHVREISRMPESHPTIPTPTRSINMGPSSQTKTTLESPTPHHRTRVRPKLPRRRTQYESWLTALLVTCRVLVVDERTADLYAEIRYGLKRTGHPIPENDIRIAALARLHNSPLIPATNILISSPGLKRLNW